MGSSIPLVLKIILLTYLIVIAAIVVWDVWIDDNEPQDEGTDEIAYERHVGKGTVTHSPVLYAGGNGGSGNATVTNPPDDKLPVMASMTVTSKMLDEMAAAEQKYNAQMLEGCETQEEVDATLKELSR